MHGKCKNKLYPQTTNFELDGLMETKAQMKLIREHAENLECILEGGCLLVCIPSLAEF